jgi:hypothetical protein
VSAREVSNLTDVAWVEAETSKHRDHVVAHVVGATVFGYFVHTGALHLLLDIGFFWIVYLDAEMGLVSESLAISELEAETDFRARVAADADALRSNGVDAGALVVMRAAPAGCLIEEVTLSECGARRRLFVRGEASSLVVETSIDTGEIIVKED